MKDQPDGNNLHPIESAYTASAAVVGFLLTLLLTDGNWSPPLVRWD
jgi:hypothetical protein